MRLWQSAIRSRAQITQDESRRGGIQNVTLNSVSCASAGNCTAIGDLVAHAGSTEQGVLLTETHSKWAAGVKAALPEHGH